MLLVLAVGAASLVGFAHSDDPAVYAHGECTSDGVCCPSIRIGALAGPSVAGNIFAFAECRNMTPTSRAVHILLKRSSTHGASWSPNATVAAFVGGNGTSGNAAPTVLPDGQTILLAFQHMSTAHHPEYRGFVTRSTDEGDSFSVPVEITGQVKGRFVRPGGAGWAELPLTNWWAIGPPGGVIDADGNLVQCMNEEDPPVRDGGRPWVYSASTRDGRRWTPSEARRPLWGDGSGECQIARFGPGGRSLIMMARAQQNGTVRMGDDINGTHEHVVAFSATGGANWTEPVRVSGIAGPNCEGSVVGVPPRHPAGTAAAAWSLLATAPSNTVVHDSKGGLLRAGLQMYTSTTGTVWRKAANGMIDANASAVSALRTLPFAAFPQWRLLVALPFVR